MPDPAGGLRHQHLVSLKKIAELGQYKPDSANYDECIDVCDTGIASWDNIHEHAVIGNDKVSQIQQIIALLENPNITLPLLHNSDPDLVAPRRDRDRVLYPTGKNQAAVGYTVGRDGPRYLMGIIAWRALKVEMNP